MHTAILFYGKSQLTPMQAFQLGHTLFRMAGMPIKSAAAWYTNKSAEPSIKSMKVEKLALALAEGEVSDFLLYSDGARVQIATGSFDFGAGKFGAEPDLLFIFEAQQTSSEFIRELIDGLLSASVFSYGFVYHPANTNNGYQYYSLGSPAQILSHENYGAWQRESNNWQSTSPRYLDRMLRLVYPFNILNAQHLAKIIVDQLPLREWIQADQERGTITQAGINNWLWEVPPKRLIDLNNHLGQQGVLIAWQGPPPPQKKPRLP